jgi:hypothetical protein
MRHFINIVENAAFILSVNDLLLHRQSVVITMKDLIRGKFSHTSGPISVTSVNGRFVVGDGYHRLLQALLVGKTKFRAKIDSRYATEFGIASDKIWSPDVESPTLGLESLGFPIQDILKVRETLNVK